MKVKALHERLVRAGLPSMYYHLPCMNGTSFVEGILVEEDAGKYYVIFSEHGNEEILATAVSEDEACDLAFNELLDSWPEYLPERPAPNGVSSN